MIGTKQQLIEFLSKQDENSIFELTKKQEKSIRSLAQNRYWHWIICKTISEWSWDNNIWVHYMLKEMFNIETTTDLSTDEFAFMCKTIIDLFKEKYNVRIPLPNEDEDLKNLESYLF